MAKFNLDDYETVEERLAKFWEKYPNGRTNTYAPKDINEKLPPDEIIYVGELYADRNDQYPFATGSAHEVKNASPVNRTSYVENCETSALGRALANGNFASRGKRPSREEMEKVARAEQAKIVPTQDQLTLVGHALEQISEINDMAQLKNLYQGAIDAGIAYIDLNGQNIYTAITIAKKRIEARND